MIFLIILGILFLFFVSTYFCYHQVFVVTKKSLDGYVKLPNTKQYNEVADESERMIREAMSIPYEEVTITSSDGLTLFARYYETDPRASLQIMFHGYKSSSLRDFSGGLSFALNNGYNVLLVDQRAHGRSGGKCLTFGIMERYDCLSWIQYAIDRFGEDVKIVLYGMSMGSATVLMATALPLPENVKGVIADCGYTAPSEIIQKVIRDHHCPPKLLYPLIRLSAFLYGDFDLESASASSAMTACNIPIFLIHGEADLFVPCEMSRTNYALCAAKKKRLFTVMNAGHGLSYLHDKEGYLRELYSFLRLIGVRE